MGTSGESNWLADISLDHDEHVSSGTAVWPLRIEKVAFVYARPLKLVETAFYPVIVGIQFVSRTILVRQVEHESESPSITEGEIRTLIDIGEAEGAFEPEEAELLENVFRFGDRQAREVMTPRTEIVFVEQDSTVEQFLKVYAENSHTRFPVYQGETENVTGIISSKEFGVIPRESHSSCLTYRCL